MDWLDFIAKSEWPVVVGGALLLFRKPITQLLLSLRPKKIKGFGLDAEFEIGLQKAEALTDDAPLAIPSPISGEAQPNDGRAPNSSGTLSSATSPIRHTADAEWSTMPEGVYRTVPVFVILQVYAALEATIRRAVIVLYPDQRGRRSISGDAHLIGFSEDEQAALRELRLLRNKVVHEPEVEVTRSEAERFQAVAERLINRLKEIEAEHQAQPPAKPEREDERG